MRQFFFVSIIAYLSVGQSVFASEPPAPTTPTDRAAIADDICGGSGLATVGNIAHNEDRGQQAVIDRLLVSMRESHARCLKTMDRRSAMDKALGAQSISTGPGGTIEGRAVNRDAVSGTIENTKNTPAVSGPSMGETPEKGSVCSVVDPASGLPCIKKTDVAEGSSVFTNSCAKTIEVSVQHTDLSRGLVTVHGHSTSHLSCSACGQAIITEARCQATSAR